LYFKSSFTTAIPIEYSLGIASLVDSSPLQSRGGSSRELAMWDLLEVAVPQSGDPRFARDDVGSLTNPHREETTRNYHIQNNEGKIMHPLIRMLEEEQMKKKEIPDFRPGDTVVVQVKVKEGERERLQAFEGIVIARRNRGLNSAFTVRKTSYGEGVE